MALHQPMMALVKMWLATKCMYVLYAVSGIVIVLFCQSADACWDQAAQKYGINPYLLHAIAKTESNLNPAAINRNKNGTYDIGIMQINSSWFPILSKYGLDEQQLLEPCTNIQVGAWILAQNMQRLGNSWNAVGAYNSSNPTYRLQYALKVYKNLPPALRILGQSEN
ncbi:lytic transglycosylase domain-containing protein [Undibacterium sp. SXout7W]|uniref:lytic transglycosylase domain-containing protein n=1 Tax=Undibacterium sp. SXout7W TaxID=3413049 RepID=UPI003BF08BDD